MMIAAREVEQYLATFNEAGRLNAEEVFLYGGPDDAVRGICVCWMATAPALAHAAAEGCNLVVCHEAADMREYPVWAAYTKDDAPWMVDVARLEQIEKHGITVLRVHSTVDPTHVGPALWDAVGLPKPGFSGWFYSHHHVEPTAVSEWAARIRQGLGLSHVRVTGDPARVVTEVGTCWGGGGLDRSMHVWVRELVPRGIEALIVGETSDFTQRVAMESGVVLLEAGHSVSEDPGLERLAADIGRRFPETKVIFRPQEVPWVTQ